MAEPMSSTTIRGRRCPVAGGVPRTYILDLDVLVDDGGDESLYLVVESKDCSGEEAKVDENTHGDLQVLGANLLAKDGRWAYTKITDVHSMEDRLKQLAAVASMDAFASARRLALAGGSEPRLEPIPRRRSAIG